MNEIDPLGDELRKLVRLLQPQGIRLIIGGGYGLLLRTQQIQRSGARTRFPESLSARSTNDLDVFLSAEIITDPAKTGPIRMALDQLGYTPVEGSEYFQFARTTPFAGLPHALKVDILAAPVRGKAEVKVRMDERRIRPRAHSLGRLHARITPEAVTIEEFLIEHDLGGMESDRLTVYLPHPFSYIVLKLFALRDRLSDLLKGPYHAFDIYRVIAMMTEKEWDQSTVLSNRFSGNIILLEAGEIRHQLFADTGSEGVRLIRLYARTSGIEILEERLLDLVSDLGELLPKRS